MGDYPTRSRDTMHVVERRLLKLQTAKLKARYVDILRERFLDEMSALLIDNEMGLLRRLIMRSTGVDDVEARIIALISEPELRTRLRAVIRRWRETSDVLDRWIASLIDEASGNGAEPRA